LYISEAHPFTSLHSNAEALFIFSSPGDRRALHSFPTRRSSDLGASMTTTWSAPPDPGTRRPSAMQARGAPTMRAWWRWATAGRRSEEHTSELQSRGHLVCRLLLEKKKTKPVIQLTGDAQRL